MIKQCKKCGSKNLYLEPRVKGQDILTADMVALKCKSCGKWLKWCPKDERKYYYANTQQKQDTKWQKLKEWLEEIKLWNEKQMKEARLNLDYYIRAKSQNVFINKMLDKMQELEKGEKDGNNK